MAFDPVSIGLEFVSKIADKIWPDPTAKAEGLLKLEQLKQTGELAELTAETDLAKGQQAINLAEASNDNVFISGWRPFIGWVCGVAFAYHFVLQPFMAFAFASFGYSFALPAFDMGALNTVLMGMLGLGGLRSFDKMKGASK